MAYTRNMMTAELTSNKTNSFGHPLILPAAISQQCQYCNKIGKVRCSRCKLWYCGLLCQANDWWKHREVCVEPPPLEYADGTLVVRPGQPLRKPFSQDDYFRSAQGALQDASPKRLGSPSHRYSAPRRSPVVHGGGQSAHSPDDHVITPPNSKAPLETKADAARNKSTEAHSKSNSRATETVRRRLSMDPPKENALLDGVEKLEDKPSEPRPASPPKTTEAVIQKPKFTNKPVSVKKALEPSRPKVELAKCATSCINFWSKDLVCDFYALADHIKDLPKSFSAMFVNEDSVDFTLDHLQTLMSGATPLTSVKEKEFVAVYYRSQESFLRGFVIALRGQQAKVALLDLGFHIKANFSDLYPLPQEAFEKPSFAVNFFLQKGISQTVQDRVRELFKESTEFQVEVLAVNDDETSHQIKAAVVVLKCDSKISAKYDAYSWISADARIPTLLGIQKDDEDDDF